MGSPQQPSPEQYAHLEAAGGLELLSPPRWVAAGGSSVELEFALPRHAVSLVQLSW
jgi:xylan 1,4-beta-xylosidase